MQHHIILQYPYETVQIALCKQGTIVESITEHKFKAISNTIPHIQTLLQTHNLQLCDIAFFGVNVGPGPYNTLRALLTMANGIHFAAHIPLIGLSALDLLASQYPEKNNIVLLHAFADHVFYRMQIDGTIKQGGCSISQIITLINQQSKPMLALGNAAILHQKKLEQDCPNTLIFSNPIQAFNDLEALAEKSYEQFISKNIAQDYLWPIYFETLR